MQKRIKSLTDYKNYRFFGSLLPPKDRESMKPPFKRRWLMLPPLLRQGNKMNSIKVIDDRIEHLKTITVFDDELSRFDNKIEIKTLKRCKKLFQQEQLELKQKLKDIEKNMFEELVILYSKGEDNIHLDNLSSLLHGLHNILDDYRSNK